MRKIVVSLLILIFIPLVSVKAANNIDLDDYEGFYRAEGRYIEHVEDEKYDVFFKTRDTEALIEYINNATNQAAHHDFSEDYIHYDFAIIENRLIRDKKEDYFSQPDRYDEYKYLATVDNNIFSLERPNWVDKYYLEMEFYMKIDDVQDKLFFISRIVKLS